MVWTGISGDPIDANAGALNSGPTEAGAAEVASEPSGESPAPVSAQFSLAEIDASLQDVLSGMATLTASVSAFHQRSAAQESIIARMQQRLEELQGDQVRALLRPVFEQLAALHGDINEISARELRVSGGSRTGKELAFLTDRVETAFESLGLVSVEAAPGVAFDSRIHSAVRSRPTNDADRDKAIAEVQRQGFVTPGSAKTDVHARVVVYSYDPRRPVDESIGAAPLETGPTPEPSDREPEAKGSTTEQTDPPPSAAPRRQQRVPEVPMPPMPPNYAEGSSRE